MSAIEQHCENKNAVGVAVRIAGRHSGSGRFHTEAFGGGHKQRINLWPEWLQTIWDESRVPTADG